MQSASLDLPVKACRVMLLTVCCRNYTVKVMPTPVNDAAAALRINQTKTEQALRKVPADFYHKHEHRFLFASETCTSTVSL